MFDHRISIEDKLRDFCLLSLSCSQSPLLPQFAKYKTEMTTISQHYVARGALLTAQLEIITRGERREEPALTFTIRAAGEQCSPRSQDTDAVFHSQSPLNYCSALLGLLSVFSPSVKLNDQRD